MFSYLASRLMLPMHISSTSQSRFQSCGSGLREAIAAKIPEKGELIKKLRQQYGKTVLGEVTLNQIYGGMRGLPALVCETSVLDPNEGIRFRGLSLPECQKKLPKLCESPLPEGIFWLMCTGDVPTMDQVKALSAEWADRSKLPKHVVKMLKNFPKTLHPMAQLSCAVTALSNDSCFVKAYNEGVKKTDFWQYCYEDVMDLLGKLPTVAAHIYMNTFKDGVDSACVDKDLDWSHNFCNMIEYESDEFVELMRLYLTIHADHEGGNVSAHAVKLVGSALSNPFLAYAAGMNGLAGPLHGLANQEVLLWLREVQKEVGKDPSEDKLKEIVNKTLKSGRVIPGYGHAVLRKTDPRYISQREFALKYLPDDEMFQLVSKMFAVVPPILTSLGKVQNPWPNVDAHSGVLLQYYGMKETSYYTVLFGVSRALGTMACQIWDRAMLLPIERPKSFSTEALIKMICEKKKGKGEGKDKDKGKDQPKKNAKEQDKAKDKCKSEPKKEAKKEDKAKDKCKSDPKKKAKEQDKAKDKCKSDPKKKAKEQDKAKAEDKCKTEPKKKSKEQKKATAKDHCKSETKKKDKDQAKDKCKTEPKNTAKEQKKATAKDHCKSQTKKKDKDQAKDLCKGQEKKQGKDKRKGKAKCNSNGKDKAKSKPKCNGKNKKKGQDLCNQDKGNTGPKCNGKGQGKKKK